MDAVFISLILLGIVVSSDMVGRSLPVPVPLPLVQIACGAVAGLAPQFHIDLAPDVFFLLLIPPLLFVDGWRIPADELVKDKWAILNMAVALVVATVAAIGVFIAWLAPSFSAGAAFALAAALAPTDPIAVTAIAQRLSVPHRMMNLLQAESLLNDATGLICLQFAVAFMLTGSFSAGTAITTFLWVAGAGLGVGFIVTFAVNQVKIWISARTGEDPGAQIVISLLIPFAAYLAAEALSASGLFAAVAAGATMARAEATGLALGATRIERRAVWNAVQFVANGIVFVLLGEQLPHILSGAKASVVLAGDHSLWWPLMLIVVIYAAMLLLRLVWVAAGAFIQFRAMKVRPLHVWRMITASTLAGSRGAVTFAGVLLLPVTLQNGAVFAERDLMILIAMGVIVLSLIAAGIGLPLVLQTSAVLSTADTAEDAAAGLTAATAALTEIARISALHTPPDTSSEAYAAAAKLVSGRYVQRLADPTQLAPGKTEVASDPQIVRELQIAGLRAERRAIFLLRRQHKIGAVAARKRVLGLDLMEAQFDA